MSDRPPTDRPDPRVALLMSEYRQLEPADQELILAMVARLRGNAANFFAPDVPFMDFGE